MHMLRKFNYLCAVLALFSSVVLADDNVLYLQPGALDFVGIYDLRAEDPNLNGNGVDIAVISRSITYNNGIPANDFAVDSSHGCFEKAKIAQFSHPAVPVNYSPHATAIASILVADSNASFYPRLGEFYYEGAAPAANLQVYELWYFLSEHLYRNQTIETDIISISSGSSFPDWWTRGMENLVENGTTIIAGIGNGRKASDPVLYPGASANIIGVGVADAAVDPNLLLSLSNFGLANTDHSSFGPAANRRCKPDLIAPANCIAADTNDGFVLTGNYSSFATPVVAGTAALLRQKLYSDYNDIPEYFAPLIIKSVLLSSADKLPYWHKGRIDPNDDHTCALDWLQGAGMVDAYGSMKLLENSDIDALGWEVGSIDFNSIAKFNISTNDTNDTFITASCVFNYQYSNRYPYRLLNDPDLRLELWSVDANNQKQTLLDYSDCPGGTVEHIYFRTLPEHTSYILKVKNVKNTQPDIPIDFAVSWQVEKVSTIDNFLYYDLNNDGEINNADFLKLINNIGKRSQTRKGFIPGDLDLDGVIEKDDLKLLMQKNSQKAIWKK